MRMEDSGWGGYVPLPGEQPKEKPDQPQEEPEGPSGRPPPPPSGPPGQPWWRNRRTLAAAGAAVAVAAVAVVLASGDGCGDGDGGLSKEEHVAQADDVCAQHQFDYNTVLQQFNETGDPAAVSQAASVVQSLRDDLGALGEPDADAETFQRYLDGLDEAVALFEQGDPQGFGAFSQAQAAARQYGLQQC